MDERDVSVHLPTTDLSAAARRLIELLSLRREELARSIVADVRNEVVDYSGLGRLTVSDDILQMSLLTISDLLDGLSAEHPTLRPNVEAIRRSASRRVHQEVSLPALLHSYRIWGAKIWQAVLDEAGEDQALRQGALELVTPIFGYVDLLSVTLAQVYVEESSGAFRGRDVLRSDVLESLLLNRALSGRARVELARLNLSAENEIAVVLVRLTDVTVENMRGESLAVLQACRELLTTEMKALLGVRDGDVLCLVRLATSMEADRLVRMSHELASRNPLWRVCVGRPHRGLEGIPRSFREAQDAATVAAAQSRQGRAVLFSEVILDRILIHSEYAEELLEETMRPLVAYDERHSADLVPTLRTYVSNDLNMTRTAKDLHVNPNTVAYRLKRIAMLTGYDPTHSNGMVTLALALRLFDA